MTQHFTPSGGRVLDQELDALQLLLRRVTDELERVKHALQQEGPQGAAAGRRVLAEVRQCMRLALLVEKDIEQRTATDSPAAHSQLDLDAARSSIGRRLDRLRTARGAE
ncbi:hypothetical protein [uncultured Shimia sp.]|uniref:hypothetical protein n=1 Tax=uncultured Shimia sp. TaxID=573152 RepID=UPI00260B9BB2|nr:hypothetical protein [uncultured Shimia sp.]